MNNKGFTFLEIIIVLIITGVLTAGGTILIRSALNSSKHSATRSALHAMSESIAAYGARGRSLPPDENELEKTLSNISDAFGNSVLYFPAPEITVSVTDGYEAGICSANSTSLSVTECSDTDCTDTQTYHDIAFLIASKAIDETAQTAISGSEIRIYPDTSDDIAEWMTLDALKRYAGCGASGLGITETKLPEAYAESTYSYALHPSGGTGPYHWCVSSEDAEVRENFLYNGENLESECSDMDFIPGSVLNISSASELSDPLPTSARLKIRLKDSAGGNVSDLYALKITDTSELYVTSRQIPNAVSFTVAQPSDSAYSDVNPQMLSISSPDSKTYNIDLDSNGSDGSSACAWSSGEGESFINRSLAAYFTYTPKAEILQNSSYNDMEGFTFAVVESEYVNSLGVSVSTGNLCGDSGSGLGFAGRLDYSSHPLPGEAYAVEFDLNYQESKNDPSEIANARLKSFTHMGIVNYITSPQSGKSNASNRHSYGTNPQCREIPGYGCFYSDNIFEENRTNAVRVEIATGCSSLGTDCGNFSPDNSSTCIYAWLNTYSSAVSDEMKDVTERYMTDYYSTPPFGEPTVRHCFPVSSGSMQNIRYGFTASTRWKDAEFSISDIAVNIKGY